MVRAQDRRSGWSFRVRWPSASVLLALLLGAPIICLNSPCYAQEISQELQGSGQTTQGPESRPEAQRDRPASLEQRPSGPEIPPEDPSVVEQEIAAEEVQLPREDVGSESVERGEQDPHGEAVPTPVEEEQAGTFRPSWFPEVHGFVSQGFLLSSQNNYLAHTERGSFEFSEVGLNFTKQLTERFRVGMQLFMRDLGPVGNYKPQFDWYYLDYKFADWLGIRAGRTKIPFGLYNETSDIDAARVPILLPQSIYDVENRDALLALTGGEIYGRVPVSKMGALEYRGYGGTIFLDASGVDEVQNFEIPYVVGGRLMWETPLDGLRMGGTYQALHIDYEVVLSEEDVQLLEDSDLLSEGDDNVIAVDLPLRLWVASIEYAYQDLLLATEYGRWKAKTKTDADFIPVQSVENERFYFMASYRVVPWFAPGAYYSLLFPNTSDRTGSDSHRHDLAMTLRFDPLEYWLIKLEGHFMSGTANLRPELNGGTPASELAKNWGLFLLKTTGYF